MSPVTTAHPQFDAVKAEAVARVNKMLSINGKRTVTSYHRALGEIMWNYCGMARNKAGLEEAIQKIRELRAEFWENVHVPGSGNDFNQQVEQAGRVADFLEFGELMCRDALEREESCGGHFREEHRSEDGEAKRDDEHFAHAAAWEHAGEDVAAEVRHQEQLTFETIHMSTRSYK